MSERSERINSPGERSERINSPGERSERVISTRLAEQTTRQVGATRPVVAVPLGSCEQHGPHLPLGTDTIIAEALATRLASAVDGVVVAPALAITASGEHDGFAGTLSIGTAATAAAIVELVRSAGWAAGVVLVNAHGGNADAVAAALATVLGEGRHVVAWWPRLAGGDAHAGHTETSLMLALRPDLVDRARLEAGNTASIGDLATPLRAAGVRAVSPNGVLGDPRAATLGEGTRLLDLLVSDLVATTSAALVGWPTDTR